MAHASGLAVESLSVERRPEPIGIDAIQPRFAWRLRGGGPGARQVAHRLQVVETQDGAADWSKPVWDTGRRESAESTCVAYGGPPLTSRQRYSWRVRVWEATGVGSEWSAPGVFEMGLLSAADWSARWIAHVVPNLFSDPEHPRPAHPSPAFRRRFSLSSAPRRARLYITALGVYEADINGARVSEERLAPGWTDYHKRIQYQTYDVTPLVREGDNLLRVKVGDGWYAGTVGAWGSHRYGDLPAFMCQLESDLASGETLTVVSDAEWTAADTGTWLHDLQLGERTDFRTGESDWTPVALRAAPGSRLVASRDDGIRVVDVLPAQSVRAAAPDRLIVDLGANAAGVVRLRTTGNPGQHIVIRHAEALDPNGELYTENLRGAEQQDEFVLADAGAVTLEPRFTFHGFRYAEITGVANLEAEHVQTDVLSSATRLVGSFTCSDPLVNKLQRNILTSLRANFISVPTDCPQRNERLGWTADLQIFAPTALFNADLTNMIDKWLDDVVDTQLPSGAYSDVAPAPSGWVGAGNTAWSDAGIIVPWVLYERSGDARVLERMFGSMRHYMAYLEADQTGGYRFGGRYGDWVSLGAPTDKLLIGTAYLAYVADIFARIAVVLGKTDDEHHARALAHQVRQAFQRKYVERDGRLTVETQTAYAMALGFELLLEADRAAAADRLAALVEAADTHLATGFLGTPLVMPALSENGHHELACQLLRQETYPSWLFEVAQGATSIWERWNGWTPEQGFYSPRMNSFNHYAFGAVGDWMYRYLAGLQPVEPGYRRTELRPRPGAALTHASATHESLYGRHHCGWRIEDGKLHVEAGVPANTSAAVVLPVATAEGVLLNGQPLAAHTIGADGVRVEIAPGEHALQVPFDEVTHVHLGRAAATHQAGVSAMR
jgi:alpha-L-rhamnosidase